MNNLVTVNNGVASTNSLLIAELFDRPHDNVLKSLDKLSTAVGFNASAYIDNSGKPNRMYVLTERQALIAMPFIGGLKSIDGQIMLVDAFLTLRDVQQDKPRVISSNTGNTLADIAEITHSAIASFGDSGCTMDDLIFSFDIFRKQTKSNRELIINQLLKSQKIRRNGNYGNSLMFAFIG